MTTLLYAVVLFTATLLGPSLGQYGPPVKGKKPHVTITSTLPPDVANLNYNPISTPLPDNSIGSSPEPVGGGSFPGASFPTGTVSQPAQQVGTGGGCGGIGSGCTVGQPQLDPKNPFPFLSLIKPPASAPVVSCSANGYACVPKNLCRNGIATSAGYPQTNSCNTVTHECCQVGQPSGLPVQGGCAGIKGGSCSPVGFQQPGSPTGTRPSYVTGSISPSPNPPSYVSGPQNPSASFPPNSFKPGPSVGVPGGNGIPIGGSYDGSSYPVTQSPNEKPYTGPLNTTPHPGCAAALKCVPETYCDAKGVMVSQPVFLTREQAENRVPMTDCQDPDTGIIGKCCRDPNYKDPWPGGMMNNGDIVECSAGSICQVPEICGDQNKVRPFQNCLIASSGSSGMCCYTGGQQPGGAILPSGVKPLKKPTPGYPAPQSKPFPQQTPSVQPFPQQQIPVQPSPGSPPQQFFPQQPPFVQPFPQKPSSAKPFPTQQTIPLIPSSIKPISEQTPSQQPLPFPIFKPQSQKPYPQQLPTQQSPSAQPFPQQPSSAQPFPQQSPSAQPFPQQSPSAQPFPQQTPSAQPFPQRPSSAQPFPQQTPSAQPFPQQSPSAQPFPQQTPSAQPFPQRPSSAQPFPQQTPSVQPYPQRPSSAQPFPQQTPSAQPFPQQLPSAQPFPQQVPSVQPFPQQLPSAQPFPQKPPGSQTFPQKPSGTQYFPNQSPSSPPFSQKPTSAQPIPQHGSTAQPFPQKPGVASPFPQQSISSQPFPQKPAGIQPFPQQLPSVQIPQQQPTGSQPYPSPSSQSFPQQQSQSPSNQGSQFPVPGSLQTGYYPNGGQSSQSFVPQQQAGYYNVPGEQCGVRRPANRQGLANTDAGFGEFPWQALIISNFNQSALCSAAIVSDRAVVTAAHCLQGLESSDLSVKAGVWKLHSTEQPKSVQEVEAAAIARHPKFDAGSLFNDLAIVLLEEPLHFDVHVDKICFPPNQPDISQYRECIATGWGKAALQGNVHGSVLHQIPVQMISPSVCEEKLRQTYLGRYFILNPSFQCAVPREPTEDLCKVDAGGPIACHKGDGRYELAGVYSWDVGCATTQNPTVFGGIDTEWVKSVLSRPIDDVARDELNEILKQQQQQELSGVDIDSKPGFSQGYGKK